MKATRVANYTKKVVMSQFHVFECFYQKFYYPIKKSSIPIEVGNVFNWLL